ncbi:hypothetical protein Glove_48g140 [Diversispora epigaea]|uniref:Uncharacterized protein n=1 Tax=Diversispora epigaea TaxID=1348612 RepID=A0A397JQ48_9GLOM|nr:hypothetical protein Glove_48g140 [Diversispora epigaea]
MQEINMTNNKKSIAYFRVALNNNNNNNNISSGVDKVDNDIQQRQERAEKVFYVKTLWKIDSLKNLSYPDDKVVCDLTVTDCKIFWTRTVTIVDLKRTKPENIRDISKFCGATWAALSGFDEYENHNLTCKITVTENHARLSWRWSMENASLTSLNRP